MKYLLNGAFSTILTTIVYLLGGYDVALQTLIIIVILDYITGVLSAIYHKKLNSKIGIKGIIKKLCYFIGVSVAVIIDNILGNTGIIRNLVIYGLVANDGISIVENIGKMGVKLPKKLTEVLEQLREENK